MLTGTNESLENIALTQHTEKYTLNINIIMVIVFI